MKWIHAWCAVGLLLGAVQLSLAASAADKPFPRQIEFNVRKSGVIGGGSFKLTFEEDLTTREPRYLITLADFGGMGLKSTQEFSSRILQSDLSLVGHAVMDAKSGTWIRQVFLDRDCTAALGQEKTNCFKYTDGETQLQTEIFTDYPAIDLVSSIVVATGLAADPKFRQADYNFIFNKTTKQVTLVLEKQEELQTSEGKQKVKVLSLRHKNSGQELYRFYIGRDAQGHFPVRMSFTDDDEQIDFIADQVLWS